MAIVRVDYKALLADAKFTVKPVGRTIGAQISGLDLAQPLDEETFAGLYAALVIHKVIFFRNQEMTPTQQVAFGRQFGELEVHPFSPDLPDIPEMVVLDNHEHNPVLSTDIWHADMTFREGPTRFSILRCLQMPELGGDTMWADMAAAYEGLSVPIKELITGLEAVHDFKNFKKLYSESDEDFERLRIMQKKYPNPLHPVVRTHPDTGERVLYVNPQFTLRLKGMSVKESEAILSILYEQSKTPEYQFRLCWEPGTLAMWDNALTQHYAVNDYWPARRHMERVAVTGDKPYFDADEKSLVSENAIARVHAREGLH